MKNKSFDRQLTIADIESKKAKQALDKVMNDFMHMVDTETDKAVVEVLQSLGFKNAKEGMSIEEAEKIHSELLERGSFLNISKEYNEDDTLTVKISVVKCLKELNFNLAVDTQE